MDTWDRVADPRARRARSWVLDTILFILCALLSVADATANNGNRLPVVATVLVMVGLNLPLIGRRIWPVQAFAVQVMTAALAGWWAGTLVWSVSLLVGLYTVAALKSRRDALIAAGVLELGVLAACARLDTSHGPSWDNVIGLTFALVAALAVGLYIGTRRVLLAQLRARADQLERERDQQGELAAAAERSRIAREMHDIVAHHLTVMVTLSEGAVATSAKSPERAAEVMRMVSATGREALADTRRLLGVLRDDQSAGGDGTAERRPLPDLSDLDELMHRVRAAGVRVQFETTGSTAEIPPAVQLTVYRLIQEALTNTMKHAGQGASATVAMHCTPDEVAVDITDDGGAARAGPAATPGAGRGIPGMRERVLALGGEMRTGPVHGRGWRVQATLQLQGSVR